MFDPEIPVVERWPRFNGYIADESCAGSFAAPSDKIIQLLLGALRFDYDASVRKVPDISADSQFPCFMYSTPPETNTLDSARDMDPVKNLPFHYLN